MANKKVKTILMADIHAPQDSQHISPEIQEAMKNGNVIICSGDMVDKFDAKQIKKNLKAMSKCVPVISFEEALIQHLSMFTHHWDDVKVASDNLDSFIK